MRYNPSDANADLIPSDTWCDALIVSAFDTKSKAGNEMIEAGFRIYDPDGKQPIITHYFVANKPAMLKKLCAALKLDFESGNIPAESLVNKSLAVFVKIQKDDTGKYSDKNVIAAFEAKANGSTETKQDDGIPF
jgi:hypothetical protein